MNYLNTSLLVEETIRTRVGAEVEVQEVDTKKPLFLVEAPGGLPINLLLPELTSGEFQYKLQ